MAAAPATAAREVIVRARTLSWCHAVGGVVPNVVSPGKITVWGLVGNSRLLSAGGQRGSSPGVNWSGTIGV